MQTQLPLRVSNKQSSTSTTDEEAEKRLAEAEKRLAEKRRAEAEKRSPAAVASSLESLIVISAEVKPENQQQQQEQRELIAINGDEWTTVRKGSKRCAKWKYPTSTSIEAIKATHDSNSRSITTDFVLAAKENLKQSKFWSCIHQQLSVCLSDVSLRLSRSTEEATMSQNTVSSSLPSFSAIPWLLGLGIGTAEVGDPLVFASQLAFVLLLKEVFNIDPLNTWISDPVMSTDDCILMNQLNLTPDSTCNLQQQQQPSQPPPSRNSFISLPSSLISSLSTDVRPIVLFMPHCDKPIYGECLRYIDSLSPVSPFSSSLSSSPQSLLSRCVVIGNDLTQYDQLHSQRFYINNNPTTAAGLLGHANALGTAVGTAGPSSSSMAQASEYLDKLLPRIHSIPVSEVYGQCFRAFNDICICLINE